MRLAGRDRRQVLPGSLECRKVLATEHQTRVGRKVHGCQVDTGVGEATGNLSEHAGMILDALNDHFHLAGDLVADLGDGDSCCSLVRGQQVEDDTPVLLDCAQALDIDLRAAQLLGESRRTALGVRYDDGEVVCVHDCSPLSGAEYLSWPTTHAARAVTRYATAANGALSAAAADQSKPLACC